MTKTENNWINENFNAEKWGGKKGGRREKKENKDEK